MLDTRNALQANRLYRVSGEHRNRSRNVAPGVSSQPRARRSLHQTEKTHLAARAATTIGHIVTSARLVTSQAGLGNPVAQFWNPIINSRRILMRRTVLAVVCLLVCEVGLWGVGANAEVGKNSLLLTTTEAGQGEFGPQE